jgi:hypothetical protein
VTGGNLGGSGSRFVRVSAQRRCSVARANPNKEGSHVAHDDHSDQALPRVGRVLANGLMVQNRVSNVRMDARACDTNLIVSAALLSTGYGSPT